MNYQEQLDSEEWRNKRNEIVKKDNLKCCKCNNNRILKSLKECTGIRTSRGEKNAAYILVGLNTQRFPKTFLSYDDCLMDEPTFVYTPEYLKFYVSPNELKENNIISNYGCRRFHQSEYKIVENKLVPLKILDTLPEDIEWKSNKTLEVHHKYYKVGLKAWEYPREALATLCSECHEDEHKNNKIPYLDRNNNVIRHLTPCTRCSGTGYFPEYRHVINGKCFECLGNRFEEFK